METKNFPNESGQKSGLLKLQNARSRDFFRYCNNYVIKYNINVSYMDHFFF